jgi:hypothetical protein
LDWATQREQFGQLARAREGKRMPPDRQRCLPEDRQTLAKQPSGGSG